MAGRQIWQEYDCPGCGIDFDLWDILVVGESCECSGCGGRHQAGPGEVVDTTYLIGRDGVMQCRGVPADAAQKAAWTAEAAPDGYLHPRAG